ncbi:MAG: hypothetical protein IJ561_07400 [Ruminococcus sp.]|nr:hypothetical protein [Ruminococcus sp.]
MDITGMWKIAEVNAFKQDFTQAWMTVEAMETDPGVNPFQKIMSRYVFLFGEDGKYRQLLPKELDDGSCTPYDDKYVAGKVGDWKEEDGKLLLESEDDWEEAAPTETGFEIFGFFRIEKI